MLKITLTSDAGGEEPLLILMDTLDLASWIHNTHCVVTGYYARICGENDA